LEGLEPEIAGEVLLRAGVLTSWIGSKNQVTDAQESAKNLLSESLALFESLSLSSKVAEAQTELALCYWRTGEHNEARDVLKEALSQHGIEGEIKAKALLRIAIVEREETYYQDSLRILIDNASLFETALLHKSK
jgi:tetratricopeptide (TPR) repeat protein